MIRDLECGASDSARPTSRSTVRSAARRTCTKGPSGRPSGRWSLGSPDQGGSTNPFRGDSMDRNQEPHRTWVRRGFQQRGQDERARLRPRTPASCPASPSTVAGSTPVPTPDVRSTKNKAASDTWSDAAFNSAGWTLVATRFSLDLVAQLPGSNRQFHEPFESPYPHAVRILLGGLFCQVQPPCHPEAWGRRSS